jgi:hypothetical protein
VKIGIAIAAALALAVIAFLGLRSVLDDGGAADATTEAAGAIEGDGGGLEQRLQEIGIDVEGEEAFQGGEWSIETTEPPAAEGDGGTDTVSATGTASLTLPGTVGEADRELLLYDDTTHELPVEYEIELAETDDGWEAQAVTIADPFARPAEAEESELAGLVGTARKTVDSALSLLGPGFYEQPDVYATATDATAKDWLAARAGNDQSYPPYLVDVPQSDLITGPVDRALVVAMGCEYNTADAELDVVEPATESPDATPAGHLQVAEYLGLATLRPTSVTCREGRPPRLPLQVAFGAQFARSRIDADSQWRATRLTLEFPGAEPRDVYSVARETTGDERDPAEFTADLAESVQGAAG